MKPRRYNHPIRHLGIILLALAFWLPITAFAQAADLREFLDDHGHLAIPAGFAGSLDTAGFEMRSAADGAPRFVPRGTGNTVPGEWEAFGGINHGCNGNVLAMAVDSSGLVYLGGDFTACGEVVARRVAVYDPVTNRFQSLGSGDQNGLNANRVSALVLAGGDLYVGGSFWLAGGEPANRVARWDGSQWHSLGEGAEDGVNDQVLSLAVLGSDVYVGGIFTEAGGQTANRIARWDGSQWHALESAGQNGVDGTVRSLAVSASDVYVGGVFSEAGGQSANHVARWDGSQWHALESGGQSGVGGGGFVSVDAFAVVSGDIYVGGVFSEAGGQAANHVARWDGSQWHSLGNEGQNGIVGTRVSGLAVSDSDVFVGGFFGQAGGEPANNVARWDGDQWHALESGGQNGVGSSVNTLAVIGNHVYVGGGFTRAGSGLVNRVARWGGDQWDALGSSGYNSVNGTVHAVAVSGNDVYVAGDFTVAGTEPANRIARWDGAQWHALGSGSQNGIAAGSVRALALSDSGLYVGGIFSQVGGLSASGVARWDGTEWHSLGSGAQNGVGGSVYALAVLGSDLYVGGQFTQAGGQVANRVARWDGNDWHALGSGLENGVNSQVEALATSGSAVYVGGWFSEAGGEPANRVARWDGGQWHSLGVGEQNGVNSQVQALAISGGNVYVGGFFSQAGGEQARRVARWDGSQWHALGSSSWQNAPNGVVEALAVLDGEVYVGGRFTQAGGGPANRVARWDGSQWASFGIGPENGVDTGTSVSFDSRVNTLAINGAVIHIGGAFGMAGGELSSGIASFVLAPNQSPLVLDAVPSTVLVGETSELTVSGGSGNGQVTIEVSAGDDYCSVVDTTLTALVVGECVLTATKASDGDYQPASTTALVRVVDQEGVNLEIEISELPSGSGAVMDSLTSRNECDEVSFRIRVRNNGPRDAIQARLQAPTPAGLLSPVGWSCTVSSGQCIPGSGQGAVDVELALAVGEEADIDLSACPDPNAAFAEIRVNASLPDGTTLLFPNQARRNWSAPINEDGLFRTQFD